MNYHWTICPSCSCQIAVNWSLRDGGVTGSLRRWSADRSINDGRPFVVPAADVGAALTAVCVCGTPIPLPDQPDAVGGNRSDDLRVTLTTGD
jgi:hypothetical protein